MTDGSYAFRPAEERPVNEPFLSSEEPVAQTHVCVLKDAAIKPAECQRHPSKQKESSPLTCSGSAPGASPSFVNVSFQREACTL